MKPPAFAEIECASLPASQMGRLAELRCRPGVQIALQDRHLWLSWPAGDEDVAQLLFALPGAWLFARHAEDWVEWGRRVPSFDVPQGLRYRPLDQVIFPDRIEPIAPTGEQFLPMDLRLVPSDQPQPTHGVLGNLLEFWKWARNVPGELLSRYRAAYLGKQLFVLGKALPWLEPAERFWGRRVLIPLGSRLEPAIGEESIRSLLNVEDDELLVLRPECLEVIPENCFTPLSHAGLRFLLAEQKELDHENEP